MPVRIRWMLLPSLLLICAQLLLAQEPQPIPPSNKAAFTPEVAVKLMDQILQGLQTQNQSQFLSTFDAQSMTNYGQFSAQISVLFTQYENFVGRYHVRQIGNNADRPLVIVQFDLEADSSSAGAHLRKSSQVRFEFIRVKDGWKITNVTPREFFS